MSVTAMSCLKDNDYDNGSIQSVRTIGAVIQPIEIGLTATNTTNIEALSFANSSNDTTITTFPVTLATANPAPQDIHVTLTQNNQIVSAYNAANTDTTVTATNPNPTGVVTHDSIPTLFTIVNPGGVVTIPKGQNTGYLSIKFKPSDFLGVTYALGFNISKVAESGYTISGNLSSGMIIINIKNQFDGNYQAVGIRHHPALGPLPFNYAVQMSTTGATSIEGNGLADFQQDLQLSVSPLDSVTVTSSYQPLIPIAGEANDYDPVHKVFHINVFYNTGAPRLINETLTYSHP